MLAPYLALLSPVHQEKHRFMALCAAVLSQAADLLRLYGELLPAAFSLEQAAGAQLDALDQLAGAPLPAATGDAEARAWIRAQIQLHHWDGSNAALPALLAAAFPGMDARLIDNGDGTVTAGLSGSLPFPLKDLFPCPAGIRLIEDGE